VLPLKDTVQARSFAIVNWTLIVINVLAFMILLTLGRSAQEFVTTFGLVPARLLDHLGLSQLLTVVTSMFLHGGWAHIFGNMLALYIFGDNVEDRMGHGRYLLFYMLCGIAAAAVHIAFNQDSAVPTIGASGAISGVLAAYLLLFPRARVISLVPVFFLPLLMEIPAVIYLGVWFLSQLLNGVLTVVASAEAFGGVAYWAHIGGFAAGLLLVRPFTAGRNVRAMYADEYFPW